METGPRHGVRAVEHHDLETFLSGMETVSTRKTCWVSSGP